MGLWQTQSNTPPPISVESGGVHWIQSRLFWQIPAEYGRIFWSPPDSGIFGPCHTQLSPPESSGVLQSLQNLPEYVGQCNVLYFCLVILLVANSQLSQLSQFLWILLISLKLLNSSQFHQNFLTPLFLSTSPYISVTLLSEQFGVSFPCNSAIFVAFQHIFLSSPWLSFYAVFFLEVQSQDRKKTVTGPDLNQLKEDCN